MKNLIEKSERKIHLIKGKPKRYLYNKIDWEQRLILVLGYRGVGKTTLLLQYLSEAKTKGIYLSLDDFYFETNRLIKTIDILYQEGFRLFLLDEVHRYFYWSKDLKQLYDDYPDIQLIATGSSILDLSKGNADLSRRASVYHLHGLSFREFLLFEKKLPIQPLSLEDIIQKHQVIGPDILDSVHFPKDFENYLKYGYFPFFAEAKRTYYQKLEETINLVIETDVAPFEDLQHSTVRTMKKLLYVISESVPFTPNINKLSERLEIPRNTILRLLDYMDQAQILSLLRSSTKGVSYLQKPEKIFLNNTNFIYLFSPNQPNLGNIRETFFLNQTSPVHLVTSSKYGDFMVDESFVFEVGGASKSEEQIRGVPNAYLALDIQGGNGKRIPLWLFGFLY
ncbi:ATP-binding protein [Algoriphagus kandeliae]|uniref:ATP-binding protein n=1 Tax=Algoriphagus kandeliae TaxID=2562278 RepID=A0A4Y9QRJ6_9BACT|nr:AAA family ATPase [Algoriphagus kandeliae]TFV93515.1 ATP-binding protein [Algoriphagus kandeliae]